MIAVGQNSRRFRDPFFVVMAAAMAVTVFVGFAPTFYLRSTFHPGKELSLLLVVHGFALSAWIVLFVVQAFLASSGSYRLHRRLGWMLVGLASCIMLLMAAAIVEQLRRVPPSPPPAFALAFGGFDILVFATLVGGAVARRRRSDWHKRLMLSATILLVGAATVRIVVFHGIHDPGALELSEYATALLFFTPCFVYDWSTRRRIHPASLIGLALITMDQMIQPIVLSWPAWTNLANALQRIVS